MGTRPFKGGQISFSLRQVESGTSVAEAPVEPSASTSSGGGGASESLSSTPRAESGMRPYPPPGRAFWYVLAFRGDFNVFPGVRALSLGPFAWCRSGVAVHSGSRCRNRS